jgi:hypothetical protein
MTKRQIQRAVLAVAMLALAGATAPAATLVAGQEAVQTAGDYFHDGAQSFIGEELAEAATTVRGGLSKYPGDPELTRLDALIREAMEQQQNQGEGSEQEQSENEQQENEDGGDQEQQGEPQEGEESESGEEDQEQDGEQENQENQEGDAGEQPENESEGESEQPPSEIPVDSDQLTPQEAERILQALANEEEKLLREVQKVKGRPRRVEKDW